jgi:hypothetical protein
MQCYFIKIALFCRLLAAFTLAVDIWYIVCIMLLTLILYNSLYSKAGTWRGIQQEDRTFDYTRQPRALSVCRQAFLVYHPQSLRSNASSLHRTCYLSSIGTSYRFTLKLNISIVQRYECGHTASLAFSQ